MIIQFRVGDIEATFDSEGEFLTPEAMRDYIKVGRKQARKLWTSLPSDTTQPENEGDADA